jgi:hypothetical protein
MSYRTPVQLVALLVGLTSLLVGIVGLAGAFHVADLLDLVHIALGVAGIALARAPGSAATFLTGGGVAYLALWLLGAVDGGDWIPLDTGDNWLHFVFGLAMVGLGSVAPRDTAEPL